MNDTSINNARLQIAAWSHRIVLLLSIILVVYISIDTFQGREVSTNSSFLSFQLFVCLMFIAEFFVELQIAPNRIKFFIHNLPFLIVSIPYLNIIHGLDISVSANADYYLRFLPLLRGAYVMVRVVGYMSRSRIVSIFWSYVSLMVLALYFGTLIFFRCEYLINPDVRSFGNALFFCASQMTTLGCTIFPVTDTGRLVSAILSILGMAMFPLFTVYISATIRRITHRRN